MEGVTEALRAHPRVRGALLIGSTAVVALGALLWAQLLLVPLAVAVVIAVVMLRESTTGLKVEEIDRLRQAEVELAAAPTTEDAARQLAEHALELLGAESAVVLIEGIGDTVRMTAGRDGGEVFHDGSKMRLLDDNGVPCGSIAVSPKANGKPYTARDERVLDALAQRVSATLHRLSLFAEVQGERRTLKDVLGSSSDGIFSTGPDFRIRSWNPAMEDITGVPASAAVGEQSGVIFRPIGEDGKHRYGHSDPGRRNRPTTSLMVTITTAAGEPRWLTCSYSPLSEGGYVVVARDDTERKKLQDDKDGWIAQVSHELRTPLTPIKAFLHTLSRRDAQLSSADRLKIYDVMLRQEGRLENLVNSLLQATAIDSGDAYVPAAVMLDWRTIVTEQVESAHRQDPSRDITVHFPPRMPQVIGDLELATGLISNLLSNALKYTPPGSPLEVHISEAGEYVETVVADAGPGIAPSDRTRVFEKFTRLGDHLTRPEQGVGLGLYIAQQAVQRMGGEIEVVDSPLGGAAFRFTLRAASERERIRVEDAADLAEEEEAAEAANH